MPTSPATNPDANALELDAVILGTGIAGLWTLDRLYRDGYRVLAIEKSAVADGQTVWSQGIIHSGLKYTLAGALSGAARAIRDLPERWTNALAGAPNEPDLSSVKQRAPHCHLWRTTSLASKLGMIGARAGLKTKPVSLSQDERPNALRGCQGTVAQLNETEIGRASCRERV